MPFYYGAYDWDTILSTIANDLAATGDWEIYDNQVANGICVRHVPSNRFLCLQKKGYTRTDVSNSAHRSVGIQAILSSTWDSGNHQPAGTVKSVFGELFHVWSNGVNGPSWCNTYLADYMGSDDQYTIWLWVDKAGFVLAVTNPMGYSPSATYSDVYSFFMSVEIIPAAKREYADGLGDFFMIAISCNQRELGYHNMGTGYVHFYARDLATESGYRAHDKHEIGAIKSLGSGKVYFEFPYLFNDPRDRKTVAAQTRRWFFVAKDMGLAVNDIINWIDPDAGVTRQFVVAQVAATGSNANPNNFLVAIPYSNAADYS